MRTQQQQSLRKSTKVNDSSIINKIVVYGVKDQSKLKMSDIKKNEIKVGILEVFRSDQIKLSQSHEKIKDGDQMYQMWVYPDGIKIYNSKLEILNDSQPQFSFFQPNQISLQKIKNPGYKNQSQKSNKFLFYDYKYNEKEPPQYVYSFVLTDYQLNRTYCTCLTWNEKRFIQNDLQSQSQINKNKNFNEKNKQNIQHSQLLPKCTLQDLMQDPLILDKKTSLVYIPKGFIICSKMPCLTFQKQLIYFFYANVIKQYSDVFIRSQQIQKFKKLINKYGFTEAEKIFDQQEFLSQKQAQSKRFMKELPIKPSKIRSKKTTIRKQLQKKYENQNLKHLKQINKQKILEFYLSFMFLPELNSNTNNFLNFQPKSAMKIQIENTIYENIKFQPLYVSQTTCFKVPNIPIIEIINRAGIQNILTIWKNALVQKQILFFSSDQDFTIHICQTILYLLQPLKWENIFIPFLPFHLYHHIEAPGGYLIGMSKIHMNYMIQHFNMQNKVLVDLDQMIIIQQGGGNTIQIPKSIKNWMIQRLLHCGLKTKQVNNNSLFSLNALDISKYFTDEKYSPSPTTYLSKIDPQQRQHLIIFEIQKIFLEAILYLLNNYSSFISIVEDRVCLQRQKYLEIFPDEQWKTFAQQIYKTMMFIRLCQFHLNAEKQLMWNQKNFYGLFVYCHLMIIQQQKQKKFWIFQEELKKEDDQKLIKSNISNSKNTVTNPSAYISYVMKKNLKEIIANKQIYKVEHYLAKYLCYLQLQNPGLIKTVNKNSDAGSIGWTQWIWKLIEQKQIKSNKNSSKRKKLNSKSLFSQAFLQTINLSKIFQQIKQKQE